MRTTQVVPALPLLTLLPLALGACSEAGETDAARIVAEAIEAHGGERYERSRISFRFRDAQFTVTRNGGLYRYERIRDTEEGTTREVMSNDSIYREVDGERQPLDEEGRGRVETGVHSTIYFALLPYRLEDPAVRLRYLERTTVAGEPYDKVEVTFTPEGGGTDWEDRFVHWFHADDRTLDYLAYRYHRDGGGTRFRIAHNRREVGGILFQDYINLRHDGIERIEDYDDLWENGRTEHVSDVILEDVRVEDLPARASRPEGLPEEASPEEASPEGAP